MSRRVQKRPKVGEGDLRKKLSSEGVINAKQDSDSHDSEDDVNNFNLDEPNTRKKITKRSVITDDDAGDCNAVGELEMFLQNLGSNVQKSLIAKRKRLEEFSRESVHSTTKRVLETTKGQSEERRKMIEGFQHEFESYIAQGQNDIQKLKESEEKFWKLIQQQQRQQQQMRIAQEQRLKTLKDLGEKFFHSMNELENKHVGQYSLVQSELRKEMAMLQKQMLMESQNQEVNTMKKNLHSMLFTA